MHNSFLFSLHKNSDRRNNLKFIYSLSIENLARKSKQKQEKSSTQSYWAGSIFDNLLIKKKIPMKFGIHVRSLHMPGPNKRYLGTSCTIQKSVKSGQWKINITKPGPARLNFYKNSNSKDFICIYYF